VVTSLDATFIIHRAVAEAAVIGLPNEIGPIAKPKKSTSPPRSQRLVVEKSCVAF
jgi:hypothetical protein